MANRFQYQGQDINIKLVGDSVLISALRDLDYQTQQRYLKMILKDAANKKIVPPVKREVPRLTGRLEQSIGTVMGKSKRNAVVFAGPRMSRTKFRKVGGKEVRDDRYNGWVANIFEYAKSEWRYPKNAKRLQSFQYPPKYHQRVRGLVHHKTNIRGVIKSNLNPAGQYINKSLRDVITRAWNRGVKKAGKMGITRFRGVDL